jgi:hypothetical protein
MVAVSFGSYAASLSGRQWIIVLALSLIAPAVVAIDKVIQLRRQRKALEAQGGG